MRKQQRLAEDDARNSSAVGARISSAVDVSERPSSSNFKPKLPRMFELKAGEEFKGWSQELGAVQNDKRKNETLSLAERLDKNQDQNQFQSPTESSENRREVTFSLKVRSYGNSKCFCLKRNLMFVEYKLKYKLVLVLVLVLSQRITL